MAGPVQARDLEVAWEPQPGPQTALLACPCFEAFFGGARGGGKTDGVLGEFASHADLYGVDAIGLMIRRKRTQLIETIERSRMIYSKIGAVYHDRDSMWRFPNGARLRFAYLERDADADSYQGHSYTRLLVEEIGTFPTPRPILKLIATLRSAAGVPVGLRATGNPGGPGHGWVKQRYIDPHPRGWKIHKRSFTNPFTGETVEKDWVYIPSRLDDNRYLGPDYVAGLQMVGGPELVKAWLEGDWNAIEGAFFAEFSESKHCVRPFAVPADWPRFRSMDWGSASPFSVGWWAIVGEDYRLPDGRTMPRGALLRYREWYGAKPDGSGLKMTAEEVAEGIKRLESGENVSGGVIDPSAFKEDGGPSIGERMIAAGVNFRPADNTRIAQRGAMGGWDLLRARLKGVDDQPMMYVFDTCTDFIRTVPALPHDEARPEDVDTDAEDHVADEVRYACSSRPWVPPIHKPDPVQQTGYQTYERTDHTEIGAL